MQGVIAQIVPARPALLRREGGQPVPPVLFVHMAQRDPEWAAQIEETLRYCRWGWGGDGGMLHCRQLAMHVRCQAGCGSGTPNC